MNFSLLLNYQGTWNNTINYAVQPLLGVEPLTYISPLVVYNNTLYLANFNGGINPPVGVTPNISSAWTFLFSSSPPILNGIWTWISGTDTITGTATYGTKGVPSINNIPGARYGSSSWVDSSGIIWIFGGYGIDSTDTFVGLNDLWTYNPLNNEWAWISGSDTGNQYGIYGTIHVGNPSNIPGQRKWSNSWIDITNDILWLFGGGGKDSTNNGLLNDLWTYTISTGLWAWQGGSNTGGSQPGIYGTKGIPSISNIPGGRQGSPLILDSTNNIVWMFGGNGLASTGGAQFLNDLWHFNPNTLEWTWVGGSNIGNQHGVYGTKGVPSINNIPGARAFEVLWIDSSGMIWLFGGQIPNAIPNALNNVNDLWHFNPNTLEWTWVGGSNIGNQHGVYGTKGVPSINNIPGARDAAASWIDIFGNLWLFGGQGYDINGTRGDLNDLWHFNPNTLEWTWVGGSNIVGQSGVFGTKGIPSPSNIPPGLDSGVSWIDASGDLWMFSGENFAGAPSGIFNTVWKLAFP